MGLNGRKPIPPQPPRANPSDIVTVKDFGPNTLRTIIEHLELSTEFEHMVYREAELDAIWSITSFILVYESNSSSLDAVKRLNEGIRQAHDLVADQHPQAAATLLRTFV